MVPTAFEASAGVRRPAGVLGSVALLLAMAGCVVVPAGGRHHGGVGDGRPAPRAPAPPLSPPPVAAGPMYFYPERGQREPQIERDRYECYRWAVDQTGVDPGMTPLRSSAGSLPAAPPPRRDGGEVVAGAATGAVLGSVIGAPRHAGEGAVLGAVFGAMLGSAAQQQRERAADVAQARRDAAAAQARQPAEHFRRAMSACMAGRGYRVG